MKTRSHLFGSAIFLLTAILLTGCVGGFSGGADQTVQSFLNEVTSAAVSLRPERIAALIDFPIVFTDENVDINITSANFVDLTKNAFEIARAGGTRLLVKITVEDDGIIYSGDIAVIKDAVLSVELEIKEETARELWESIGRTILEELEDGNALFSDEEIDEMLADGWKELRYEIAGEGEWPGQWGPVEEELEDFELKKVGAKWKFSTQGFSYGTLGILSTHLQ